LQDNPRQPRSISLYGKCVCEFDLRQLKGYTFALVLVPPCGDHHLQLRHGRQTSNTVHAVFRHQRLCFECQSLFK
jgi:hypothetical protein